MTRSFGNITPRHRGRDGSRVCDPCGLLGQSPDKKHCKSHSHFVCDMPYKLRRPPRQSFEFAPASVDEIKLDEALPHPYETEGIYSVS